jgi:hypothetical protein
LDLDALEKISNCDKKLSLFTIFVSDKQYWIDSFKFKTSV